MPEPDPLDELRDRIRATEDAARRLAGAAAGARADDEAGRIPPAGWATPGEQGERADELQALVAALEALRALLPDELRDQVTEVIRSVLLLIRSLIDWWVARLEAGDGSTMTGRPPARGAGGADGVSRSAQDIPVE